MKKVYFVFLIMICVNSFAQTIPAYKNSTLSPDVRAKDLLSRMTPEEKFWQLFMCPGDTTVLLDTFTRHGIFGLQVSASSQGGGGQMLNYNTTDDALALAKKNNTIQHYFVEKTRLGIPAIMFDEALHGLVRAGSTAFPQAIGLSATFDTALMHRVASDISDEVEARGIRQILSPVINIASDQRWGRVEESYGEDPVLTSAMGVAFISAFENKNIITTPKHFIANVGDGGRDSYPIYYDEQLLDEIYFPPFKAVINKAGARSIMTAYNSLNGISCSSNSWLLLQKLKKEWGFKGFVISDANAVGGDIVLHHTAKNYADAGAHAINNGLDVIFQSDLNHYKFFLPAFLDGRIDTSRINDAVFRVLRAKFELGLFENPYVDLTRIKKLNNSTEHKKTALQAALESVVLLKNKNNMLPLKNNIHSIAVIGEDATAGRLGGYSGPGSGVVNILDGIKARTGRDIKINYAEGATVMDKDYDVVESSFLSDMNNMAGLTAEYFNNIDFSGEPAVEKTDKTIDFLWTLSLPDRMIETNFYSVRWSGKIHSPRTGNFKIGLEGNDGYRLFINDSLLINHWDKQSYHTSLADFYFEKDKPYNIRIEFYEPVGNAKLKLVWNVNIADNWQQKIQQAVNIAKQSDVAIVVAGIHEGEFQDRGILSLPGHQEELINAVAKTGKPVVVLLVGGSAITMNNWIDNVDAIADVWYPGEEGGNAIAGILFGDYNPAGRLPITFPISEGQLPLVYNHAPTGRGDDYYNLSGLPLFPFGYGLSYTTFTYKNLTFEKDVIHKNDEVLAHCTVINTGKFDGDEVVQLYIHQQLASVAQPVIQLKSFQRIHLKAGESKEVSFMITPQILSMLDKNLQQVVEPGNFDIMIGASSRDIRLKKLLKVE
ncbi:MAG: glycoside hydrolase family 3 C-terminal domain-containing protein [Bacteroidetes bacterium]|nr:glycoside hydrolase family 3 C-terminal domain-containing protein [Bacteroidota bacterium]